MTAVDGRTFIWHPADGSTPIVLTEPDTGWRLLTGVTGLGMTTYSYTERRIPGQAGARTTSVRADPRDIDLEFLLEAADEEGLRARMQQLIRAMRPWTGDGQLEVIYPSGESRSVRCRYTDGLEGSEARGVTLPGRWWRGVIGLHAAQPYAAGPTITVPWSLEPSGIGWFPIIPIRLGPPGIGGRRTVTNPGDAEATYPLIVVQGPGHGLVARNRTTGRAANLDYTIPGEGPASVITINTAPGAQSVTDGVNRNLFEHLTDDDPSLWSLAPGDNDIEVQLLSTGPGSSVIVTFDPLYESL